MTFRPRFITFDCYGTLTKFRMADMAREYFPDRVAPDKMEAFVKDFAAYRLDEVLGAWKPYAEVIHNAVWRTCKKWGVEFREEEPRKIYEAVPTWGPHPDVPEGLAKVAKEIPLVIVFTAQQAQAYKPRLQAFEYMLDNLGCPPEEIMHVSSSFRYDQMSARDLGMGARVWVKRGHEPRCEGYVTHEIDDIGGLPGLVGL
jgi:2-haloacid dehalogenase